MVAVVVEVLPFSELESVPDAREETKELGNSVKYLKSQKLKKNWPYFGFFVFSIPFCLSLVVSVTFQISSQASNVRCLDIIAATK